MKIGSLNANYCYSLGNLLDFRFFTKGTKAPFFVELVCEMSEFPLPRLCELLFYQHDPAYLIFLFIIKDFLKLFILFLFKPP